jgi:uncharacterized protein
MARRKHFLTPLLKRSTRNLVLRTEPSESVVATTLETAFESSSRNRGLLGRNTLASGTALILAPCSLVHTFGMRFPIDICFVARDGCVLSVQHSVKPWRIAGCLGAFAALEFAAGYLETCGVTLGDLLTVAGESAQLQNTHMFTDGIRTDDLYV